MCTVSWTAKVDCYRLYFNRDEQRSRPRATPPQIQTRDDTRILSPTDPQGGGSWIAVNDRGVCAFLLNNYGATRPEVAKRDFRSRGELPLIAVSHSCVEDGTAAIEELDLDEFRPFILGMIGPDSACRLIDWSGTRLAQRSSDDCFVTTSSFETEEVEAYRLQAFTRLREFDVNKWGSNQQFEYHCDRSHSDKAYNPLMSREDAETHSVSVISVGQNSIEYDYYERSSGTGGLNEPVHCAIALGRRAG